MSVAEKLIDTTDWSHFRAAGGNGGDIGPALADLLSSLSPEAAEAAYWKLENHVVVQGEVFDVAVPTVAVLVASLVDPRPRHVRISALDLLFQVLSGYSSREAGASDDLLDECRRTAEGGLYALVREAMVGERNAAWDVLDQLGLDDRLAPFRP